MPQGDSVAKAAGVKRLTTVSGVSRRPKRLTALCKQNNHNDEDDGSDGDGQRPNDESN